MHLPAVIFVFQGFFRPGRCPAGCPGLPAGPVPMDGILKGRVCFQVDEGGFRHVFPDREVGTGPVAGAFLRFGACKTGELAVCRFRAVPLRCVLARQPAGSGWRGPVGWVGHGGRVFVRKFYGCRILMCQGHGMRCYRVFIVRAGWLPDTG